MPTKLEPPAASDEPDDHADFLELKALDPDEDGAAIRELIRDLRIGGSSDGLEGYDAGAEIDQADDDLYEGIAEAAFAEIDQRRRSCGEVSYPFEIANSVISPSTQATGQVYLFMALLSHFGVGAGPAGSRPTKMFEDICASAARGYLGDGAKALVFGFPRRVLPPGFGPALDAMCGNMGEGLGHKASPVSADQKDAKLDIVAWKDFADRRAGKLILFGQCAAGNDWYDKITELPEPGKWCEAWLLEVPLVNPMRLFFVPHRVRQKAWANTNRFGGVLFDRCRIAQYALGVPEDVVTECQTWSEHVIKHSLLV